MQNKMFSRKPSWIRYIVLIAGMVNTALTLLGKPVIPQEWINGAVDFATLGFGLYMAFKNNYLTQWGEAQAKALKEANVFKRK